MNGIFVNEIFEHGAVNNSLIKDLLHAKNGQTVILVFNGGNLNGLNETRLPFFCNPIAGTVEENLFSFTEKLKKDRKSPKTIKGYTADVRNVMAVISKDFFREGRFQKLT